MNTWTIMIHELRRLFRSRTLVLNMFLLPLVLIFLLGASLSGVVGVKEADQIEPVRVAVVNAGDGGAEPSAMITAFLETPEVKDIIIAEKAESRAAAESGLRTGKYAYAVIVPSGFDSGVQRGEPAQLEFILGKNHTDNLVAGTAFDNFLSTLNYKQAAVVKLGPEALNASPASPETPAVVLGDLNNGGRSYTASQFYAASMLLMFLLYSGLTVAGSLFNDKENHTLFRIQSMPVKGSQLFIGKMLGVGLVSIVQCLAIVLLSDWLFGVYWGNRPGLLVLFCLLMIIASMTFSIVICLFSKTASSATNVINVLTVVMTFASGGMAPLPESWVNSVGAFTLNHWVLQAMIRMMLHSSLPQILPNLWVMCLICVVLFAAVIVSYRKVCYHE
ncbi:ABC transporter permease [Paenibacillus sp. MMS20-IR301]|uniref:ABC transporter permease n=1 Tax=Paenibacillus sp. MMS20-IR301 TaxID=2895946 RepID=UPI0028E30797|nr:ABC transporter permease [Paenibacillus sp. MMS20-IR301]WNS42707.1 ABC transporter permease [Paenibacillus sp. MMS20-IR301]